METAIFYAISVILILEYFFGIMLDRLNVSSMSETLPDEGKDIYDEKKYAKQQSYTKTNIRFATIQTTISFIITFLLFITGTFGKLHDAINTVTANEILNTLLFLGVLYYGSTLLDIPFSYYKTFVIEERFGFNNSTFKIFFSDKVKSLLITTIVGGVLIASITWIYGETQNWFWLLTLAIMTFVMLFTVMFYSTLIVPLFNKQKPLEDGELKQAIQDFCNEAGFQLTDIFVIDGSKRSKKANAYFTGLGKRKRIVLFDTLINDLSVKEIVAVLAHEIGHYKHKHIIRSMVTNFFQSGVMFYLLGLFIGMDEPSKALGSMGMNSFALGLFGFTLLYSPISTVLGIINNGISRKNEFEADAFATKYGLGKYLIAGLKKLSVNNLSNLTPHPWCVTVYHTHPPVLNRIKAINNNPKNVS